MSIQMPYSVSFPQGVKYNSMLPQAVAQGKVATRKYYATNSNSNFSFASTNEIRIDISADRNTFLNTAISSSQLINNTWQFLAATFDGQTIKIYINGNIVICYYLNGDI